MITVKTILRPLVAFSLGATVLGSVANAEVFAHACQGLPAPAAPPLDAERLTALEAAGGAILKAIPETASDTVAVTMATVPTPEGLAEWIATHTALRAYRGTLRGAKGVLADRQGNTLDRSLLLAELLTLSGYDARLARGTISGGDLAVLRGKIWAPAPLPAPAPIAPEHMKVLAPIGDDYSQADFECALALGWRIEDQTQRLLEMLATAGITDANGALADEMLKDHWWVQLNDAGTWRDLDPTGLSVSAEWTGTPDALPADLAHEVSITVTVQIQIDGQRQDVPLIAIRDRASAFSDGSISLYFEPKSVAKADPADLDAWLAATAASDRWAPVITYRDQIWAGRIFGFDGKITDYVPGLADQARTTASTAGGLIGGLTGGRGASKGKAGDGAAVALWIDYGVHVPGQSEIRERRMLFGAPGRDDGADGDTTGTPPPDRAAAMAGQYHIYVTSGDPAGYSMPAHAVTETLDALRGLRAVAAMGGSGKSPAPGDLAGALPRPAPSALYALLMARAEDDGDSLGAHYTSPTIFSISVRPGQSADSLVAAFDIVRNDVPAGLDLDEAIRRGVTDTVLESYLIADALGAANNAATAFAKDDVTWTLLLSDTDVRAQRLPPRIADLIRSEIARGYVIAAPARTAGGTNLAFWRIDPRTGTTLGMTAVGTGGAAAEYTKTVASIGTNVLTIIGCYKLTHEWIFSKKEGSLWSLAKIGGCLLPLPKLIQSVAKLRKIAKLLRELRRNKMLRRAYGRYRMMDRRLDVTQGAKASDMGKFLDKMSPGQKAFYDKVKELGVADFKDATSLLDKVKSVWTNTNKVRDLGVFFIKSIF